jgi:hypothetical protein
MSQHLGSIWLEQHWNSNFLRNDCWVAASATGIVELSSDLRSLMNGLQSMNISMNDLTIAYVYFEEIQ